MDAPPGSGYTPEELAVKLPPPPAPDALRSIDAPRTCVALYERGRDAIPPRPTFNRALADPTIFDVLCAAGEALGYTVG